MRRCGCCSSRRTPHRIERGAPPNKRGARGRLFCLMLADRSGRLPAPARRDQAEQTQAGEGQRAGFGDARRRRRGRDLGDTGDRCDLDVIEILRTIRGRTTVSDHACGSNTACANQPETRVGRCCRCVIDGTRPRNCRSSIVPHKAPATAQQIAVGVAGQTAAERCRSCVRENKEVRTLFPFGGPPDTNRIQAYLGRTKVEQKRLETILVVQRVVRIGRRGFGSRKNADATGVTVNAAFLQRPSCRRRRPTTQRWHRGAAVQSPRRRGACRARTQGQACSHQRTCELFVIHLFYLLT